MFVHESWTTIPPFSYTIQYNAKLDETSLGKLENDINNEIHSGWSDKETVRAKLIKIKREKK